MQAFTYQDAHQLADFAIRLASVPDPAPGPHDLLVRIKAFAFNPADYKVRQTRSGGVILGWDAAGVVEAVGAEVRGLAVGDEVYYAGDMNRAGSHAELQTVDARIVARKPRSLSFAEAAAVPLTALTAWEALFERPLEYPEGSTVLVIGGAGGVGSIAVQLLKALTPATVVATASRPETVEWVRGLGADRVIGRDLKAELPGPVDVVFSTTHTLDYLGVLPELIRPFGSLALIDDPDVLDIAPFKWRAQSVHWEFMFAKSMHGYRLESQRDILARVGELIDGGKVRTTLNEVLPATEAEYRRAHSLLESGKAHGKLVMEW